MCSFCSLLDFYQWKHYVAAIDQVLKNNFGMVKDEIISDLFTKKFITFPPSPPPPPPPTTPPNDTTGIKSISVPLPKKFYPTPPPPAHKLNTVMRTDCLEFMSLLLSEVSCKGKVFDLVMIMQLENANCGTLLSHSLQNNLQFIYRGNFLFTQCSLQRSKRPALIRVLGSWG